MLHAIYSVQNEGVDRVVIHGNDTDIIVICLYYAASILQYLPELWVRTAAETYLPIHQMAKALRPKCRTLPFIHSLSGRDTTSYPFFTGKKTWLNCSYSIDIPELERFGASVGKVRTVTRLHQTSSTKQAILSLLCTLQI